MANVLTGNIFLTKSRQAIDRLFFSQNLSTSYKEKRLGLTDEQLADSFIVSPSTNEGLIRFEFSMAYMGKTYATLELVETSQLLELFVMGNDPMANLLSSKLDSELEDILAATESPVEDELDGRSRLAVATSKLASSKEFYLAFGTGDDIREWAGPYKVSLAAATLSNTSDNVRVITAQFVPNINSHKVWSKRFNEEYGYASVVDNYNEMLSRSDYVTAEGSVIVNGNDRDVNDPDLNIRVRNVVKNYLSNVTKNDNVVVSLSNDFKIPAKYIQAHEEYVKKDKVTSNMKVIRSPVFETALNLMGIKVARPMFKGFGDISLKPKAATLSSLFAELALVEEAQRVAENVPFSDILKEAKPLPRSITSRSGSEVYSVNRDYLISRILVVGGIKLGDTVSGRTFKDIYLENEASLRRTAAAQKSEEDRLVAVANVIHPDTTGKNALDRIAEDSYELIMGIRLPVGETSDDKTPLLRPLYTFCAGLREVYSAGNGNRFTLYEETNLKILKLWKKYKIISDENKPAVVFGDRDAIHNILYLKWYNPSIKDVARENVKSSEGNNRDFLFRKHIFGKYRYIDYATDFVEAFNLKSPITANSTFQDSNPPVNSIDVVSRLELEDLYKTDLLFKHNIARPNILDLKYTVDTAIVSLLSLNVDPKVIGSKLNSIAFPLTRDVILALLDLDFIKEIEAMVENSMEEGRNRSPFEFLTALANNTAIQKYIAESLKDQVGEGSPLADLTPLDISSFISFIRFIDGKQERPSTAILTNPEKYTQVYASIYSTLKTLAVKVSITTLPLFSSRLHLNKECSLVGLNSHILGTRPRSDLAPYTGIFVIRGFTHVIEPENLYSKFDLVRSSFKDGGKELTIPTIREVVEEHKKVEVRKDFARDSGVKLFKSGSKPSKKGG